MFLSEAPIDAPTLLAELERSVPNAGGVVSFTGIVRPQNAAGAQVESLFLQAHPLMTEREIEKTLKEAKARWPLEGVRLVHRIGQMRPGDTIVVVAAASVHRRAAFEATDFLMDYLKTDAIFWKKETTQSGADWIEPRAQDYSDSARWTSRKDPSDARHQ